MSAGRNRISPCARRPPIQRVYDQAGAKKETGRPVSFHCLTIVMMIGMTSYTITSGRTEAYYGQQQGDD